MFRVQLATDTISPIAEANTEPLDGPTQTEIVDGTLVARRGKHAILVADARGAHEVAWQIERDDVLYLSLYRSDGAQTYHALRPASGREFSIDWCRVAPNDGPGGVRGAFATKSGPIVVRRPNVLVGLRPETGVVAWQIPWNDGGAPFTLFELPTAWGMCDRDIAVIDRGSNKLRWQHSAPADVATFCYPAGDRVIYAMRKCGESRCLPAKVGALAATTGAPLWTAKQDIGSPLMELDGDHVLVALKTGVGVLDARTGQLGAELELPHTPWKAERIGDDVLLHGKQTARIGVAPLALQWRVPYSHLTRVEGLLLATKSVPHLGKSWLVRIDAQTGAMREIELPQAEPGFYERGGATIIATSSDEIEVVIAFGVLE